MEASEIESAVMFADDKISMTNHTRLLVAWWFMQTQNWYPRHLSSLYRQRNCPGQHLGRVSMDNLIISGERRQCKNNLIPPRLTLQCTFDYGNFLGSNVLVELLKMNTFTCQGYPTCCRRLRTLASTFLNFIPNSFKQTAGAHISSFTSQFLRLKFVSYPKASHIIWKCLWHQSWKCFWNMIRNKRQQSSCTT